jgi:SPP1 family predicted phage head-tail adaptor
LIAGDLDQYVKITRPFVADTFSAARTTYVTYCYAYAGIKPSTGDEMLDMGAERHRVTHNIKMRYIPGLLPSMRIEWNNRVFRILSLINVKEENREYMVKAMEVVNRA